MENRGKCVDCDGPVKTAGRVRCVPCANRARGAAKRAAWPLCVVCHETRVSQKRNTVCTECWLATRGRGATPEAEAERVRKIVASGIGKYERTPEIREKYAAARVGLKIPATTGERHWNWKGGRKGDGGGYVLVLVDGEYQKEHRVLMERHLGRPLVPGEEVHHVNGVRSDNRIENLVVGNRSRHRRLHDSLQRAAYEAVQAGLIAFDGTEYHLVGGD
jgi:hypothetical protein